MKDKCVCGKEKYDFQELCWSCDEKKEIINIWEYAKDNKEVTNEKYVLCPYCGLHYGEDDLHESTTLTCDGCGKKFKLEVNYDIRYSTYQIEEELKCL